MRPVATDGVYSVFCLCVLVTTGSSVLQGRSDLPWGRGSFGEQYCSWVPGVWRISQKRSDQDAIQGVDMAGPGNCVFDKNLESPDPYERDIFDRDNIGIFMPHAAEHISHGPLTSGFPCNKDWH